MITTLEEIKKAVSQLTLHELVGLRIWFTKFDRQRQEKTLLTGGASNSLNEPIAKRLGNDSANKNE